MLKRCIIAFFSLTLLCLTSTAALGQPLSPHIDQSALQNGLVKVNYTPAKDVTTKLMISKGDKSYTYSLKSSDQYPLQLGNGEYTVSILENVIGNQYRVVKKEKLAVKLTDKNKVFLQSTQIINWQPDMEAIKKAKQLTEKATNDSEKITAIYNYIVTTIRYDHATANTVVTDYVPSIEQTLQSAQGICYDYSALMAAMLRSVGVPSKLVMGQKNDIPNYHAWNLVYVKDRDEWLTIDPTYDAAFVQKDLPSTMIKNSTEYVTEREY